VTLTLTEAFLLMASADFSYCIGLFIFKIHKRICQGFHKITYPGISRFVNSAANWRIVVRIFVLLALALRIVSV